MRSLSRFTHLTVLVVAAVGLTGCSTALVPSPSPVAGGSAGATPSLPAVSAPPGSAASLQDAFVNVVNQVKPAVVQIETTQGLGSGIIYDAAGDIVTNAHVVGTATTFKVTLASGKVYTGSLVGKFAADDLAVVKITATGLTPAKFANSDTLKVGDIVMAIGNPLGLSSSVTEGIVSATGRSVDEGNGNTLPNTIQTSAAINPGNSGGALVDLNGEVVGIPTLAALDQQLGGSAPGIGFAIPSNVVSDIAGQIIASGHVVNSHRAYIGVHVSDLAGGGGVVVVNATAGGPAAKAGIVAGDQITSVDGHAIASVTALTELLASLTPGQSVAVAVTHQDGGTATINVTLAEIPTS